MAAPHHHALPPAASVSAALGSDGVRPGDPMLDRRAFVVIPISAALVGCSGQSALSPEAERGRQVYLAHCTSCHSSEPAQNGPLGPAVKGSSRALLEARLLRGAYPPGYTPKRPSAVMQPMPHLAGSLDDLGAFLQ
jgi:mono/diheme cytochrome c family protein